MQVVIDCLQHHEAGGDWLWRLHVETIVFTPIDVDGIQDRIPAANTVVGRQYRDHVIDRHVGEIEIVFDPVNVLVTLSHDLQNLVGSHAVLYDHVHGCHSRRW
uniref:ORF111 n=1 Tax=Malaco herpesvirus 1 TaxID=3031797 RepID=A0AA48SFI0_9VIRU|nr:TPA_asm: ORF111 [Malaco herpesvirus 1]